MAVATLPQNYAPALAPLSKALDAKWSSDLRLGFFLFSLFVSGVLWAQTPDEALSSLTSEYQAWVNRSCPRSLGPSLWSSCVLRESASAKLGKPDLSSLNSDLRNWVVSSCPDSLGPSLAISCLNRESAALKQGISNLSSLTQEQKNWLSSSCPSTLGPSLWVSCINRESAALSGTKSTPKPSYTTPPASQPRSYTPRSGPNSYEIEVAHNDELLIINGEKYEAQTYCLGWEEGDYVIFLEGSAFGACASAELYNLRTEEKCNVWCD